MLVVSRAVDEKLHIGGGVVVTVVRIEDGSVRLGIEAPGLTVLRGEHVEAGGDPSVPYCKTPEKP